MVIRPSLFNGGCSRFLTRHQLMVSNTPFEPISPQTSGVFLCTAVRMVHGLCGVLFFSSSFMGVIAMTKALFRKRTPFSVNSLNQ